MITSTPIVKRFDSPSVNRREILRYMGCATEDAEIGSLVDRALSLCHDKLRYDTVWAEFDIRTNGILLDLGFTEVESRDLLKCLDGCDSIVVFGATVGLEIDRLITKYGKTEPSLALCLQAIGAERIEALCDAFCASLDISFKSRGKVARPRFSAGYGDLPLSLQREIFKTLGCSKLIGLTLNESLLMSPSKSVTAIIGIKNKD